MVLNVIACDCNRYVSVAPSLGQIVGCRSRVSKISVDIMISIRAATEHEAAAISHVHVQSWRTTYAGIVPEEYLATLNEAERVLLWREWLTRDIAVYIADLDGEIVGFISGGAIRERVQTYDAELYAIYLLEKAQRQGIGRALLKELAESLSGQGFTSMIVWVLEKNPSRHFYVRTSARIVATKDIQIAGVTLSEVSYGWSDLQAIISPK
jgi:ribosomal protein S18 acetylase RimI-like enzyme